MTDSIFDSDEDKFFSPEPTEMHEDFLHVAFLFRQTRVARPASALSDALHALELRCFHPSRRRLTAEERQTLVQAVEASYRNAWTTLAGYDRTRLVEGMRAVATLVDHWRQPASAWRNDRVLDAKDLARCFRNDMHSIALREEIERRAEARAAGHELFGGPADVEDPPAIAFSEAA